MVTLYIYNVHMYTYMYKDLCKNNKKWHLIINNFFHNDLVMFM